MTPFYCYDQAALNYGNYISVLLYFIQAALIVYILLQRLTLIFEDTIFRVSKYNHIALYILIFIGILTLFVGIGDSNREFKLALLMIFLAVLIIIVIYLNYLFIFKLFQVRRSTQGALSDEKSIINLIVKTTIICISSTSFVFIFSIFFLMAQLYDSPHFILIQRLTLIGDLHSNFLSIFVSYRYFDSWYMKLCGKWHRHSIQWMESYHDDMNMQIETTNIQQLNSHDQEINE